MIAADHLAFEPLDAAFGAEVRGVDLAQVDAAAAPELLDALHRHQLLLFRDQSLGAADYRRFGARLGPLDLHLLAQFRLPEAPEIYVISNIQRDGKPIGNSTGGYEWHTDHAFSAHPMAWTMLYTLEAPESGADTVFASTYAAWEALPGEERRRLDGLDVVHSFLQLYAEKPHQPPEEDKRRWPDVVHPLVRTHPATGRDGLYLGLGDTKTVSGHGERESAELIQRLVDFATQPQFVYRHRWRPGDVVLWDNRGLLHAATPYDKEHDRRLVWRLSSPGERPFRHPREEA